MLSAQFAIRNRWQSATQYPSETGRSFDLIPEIYTGQLMRPASLFLNQLALRYFFRGYHLLIGALQILQILLHHGKPVTGLGNIGARGKNQAVNAHFFQFPCGFV